MKTFFQVVGFPLRLAVVLWGTVIGVVVCVLSPGDAKNYFDGRLTGFLLGRNL
jgi:hypothetical protein